MYNNNCSNQTVVGEKAGYCCLTPLRSVTWEPGRWRRRPSVSAGGLPLQPAQRNAFGADSLTVAMGDPERSHLT